MFDLDGTLIETASEIKDAVNDTLIFFGQAQVSQQQINIWIGHGTRHLIKDALAHVGMNPSKIEADFLKIYQHFDYFYSRRCGTTSVIYPHVIDVLKKLKNQSIKLAVITNKESIYTQQLLNHHQLLPFFDEVLSGDTFEFKKPNPFAIQYCLQKFNLTPSQALFVGDSSVDAQTARNAGVSVWLLPYGYNMGQPLVDACPDRVIESFLALMP